MSARSRIVTWAAALFKSSRDAESSAEELRFHIDAYAADLMAQGVPAAEAHRRAAAEAGRPEAQGERYREAMGLRAWDETWADVRYGLRGLRRNPGFATVAILSLGLAIGTATAMFSVVYATILNVYPYADADRTVNPIVQDPKHPEDWDWFSLSRAQYEQYRQAAPFQDVFGMAYMPMRMERDDAQQALNVVMLTANAERFLKVPALLGRGLLASDGDFGARAPDIAVLGYKYWLKQYGGDRSVLGTKIGKTAYTIVGVMPQRFALGGSPDVYMPASQLPESGFRLIAFAKLKPGVTAQQASAAVDPMIHSFSKEDPNMYPRQFHTSLQLLIDGFTSRSKFVQSLPMLFLAVSLLLLIGCANCSILLLARSTARQHEFALRAAVGATRFRIVRQLLVESLTLSLLGSALGVALSYVLATLPLQLAASLFPQESVIRLSLPVLGFCVGIAALTGLLFGFFPALRFSRPHISQILQVSSKRSAQGGGQKPLRILIGVQIALTLVLLSIAGATATGFLNIVRLRLGFNPHNVALVNIGFDPRKNDTWAERVAKIEQIRQTVEAVPGVASAAAADDIPPSGGGTQPIQLLGSALQRDDAARLTDAGPNYFSTLQIPLLAGRIWSESEAHEGVPLAVVNQAFVRRFSPDREVIGRLVRFPAIDVSKPPRGYVVSPAVKLAQVEVVGVVGNAVNDGLDKAVLPGIYANANMMPNAGVLFLVRTTTDPHLLMHALRNALWRFHSSNWVLVFPASLEEIVQSDPAWQQQRLIAALFGIFAAIALVLALVGLYSVVEYVVAQRRGEFGIRIALGARRGQILWLVLRSNLLLIGYAAAAGLLLSLLARHGMERWLAGSSQNPAIVAGAAGLLVLVAAAACLIPARRASRVDPNEALRSE